MKRRLGLIVLLGGFLICFALTLAIDIKDNSGGYNTDDKGNSVVDFSYCGYRNSNVPLPDVENAIYVPWAAGDNSIRIQQAIDYVSSLKSNKQGFKGAVLLGEGVFELENSLLIASSGIVLRGTNRSKTVLKKIGVDRGAVIYVEGINDYYPIDSISINSDYVPVNSNRIDVATEGNLNIGTRVRIVRPSTTEWIESIKCNIFGGGISALGWKAGDTDLTWDRTINDIQSNSIILDAPLTMASNQKWGGGFIIPYTWKGRISDIGIENITLLSDYDSAYPKDEDHAWTGISINNAENCWVEKVDFNYFAGSAVCILPFA